VLSQLFISVRCYRLPKISDYLQESKRRTRERLSGISRERSRGKRKVVDVLSDEEQESDSKRDMCEDQWEKSKSATASDSRRYDDLDKADVEHKALENVDENPCKEILEQQIPDFQKAKACERITPEKRDFGCEFWKSLLLRKCCTFQKSSILFGCYASNAFRSRRDSMMMNWAPASYAAMPYRLQKLPLAEIAAVQAIQQTCFVRTEPLADRRLGRRLYCSGVGLRPRT